MSKKAWAKWGLLLTGSTIAAIHLGVFVVDFLVREVILRVVD